MKKFEDVTTEKVYYVEVFDYSSNRTYRYKDSFNSYDDACNYIKSNDFSSDFGFHPISIYIIDTPKFNFSLVDLK